MKNTFEFFKIDHNSRKPKYQQIVDQIILNITNGNFKINQKVPSINIFSERFYLSRDTVERAYTILKKQKILDSVPGKGYYISNTKLNSKFKIVFVLNKLSDYKLLTYNHFTNYLGADSIIDILIYNCNDDIFEDYLNKSELAFDYYVIMPHFKNKDLKHESYTEKALNAINKIPKEKLVILDNCKSTFGDNTIEIYQDFENDIYNALNEIVDKIKKYKKLILIFPDKAIFPYPRRILFGFKKFCIEHKIEFEINNNVPEGSDLIKGNVFLIIEDEALINLLKQHREYKYKLGKDLGIISYNETPLKDLLGISVVSTDFRFMGEKAAEMILENQKGRLKAPFRLIDRNSI